MVIKKDDVHQLVDQLDNHEIELAYQFLKKIIENEEADFSDVIRDSSINLENNTNDKRKSDKKIKDLLAEATRQSDKLSVQPRKFQRTQDGKLLLDSNKQFDKDWYENDEAYDIF